MDEARPSAFQQELTERVAGDVAFDDVVLGAFATDASIYQIRPVAVVRPRDEKDVLAAIDVAAKHAVSILPRGGGTSLGGQAVGEAMVLEFTKYMNKVLELNVEQRWVRVQPGVVLDELNAQLAPHGLLFAPDPATSSRAAIGGMLGNNSSGTRSILYGIMKDHVLETKFALSDGTVLTSGEMDAEEYDRRCQAADGDGREAEIYGGVRRIIEANRDAIAAAYPKIMRRVQGYNLDAFVGTDRWDLSKLMIGSEGTLGVFLEARLHLEPLPKHKALCVVHFDDRMAAIRAVQHILEHGPSAAELMDTDVIHNARNNLALAPLCGFIQGDPGACLVVEFFGDAPEEAAQKARGLAADLEQRKVGFAWPVLTAAAEQAKVWSVRKNGLGLLLARVDRRKPLAFIEDCCVPVAVLPEYIEQIDRFCKDRGVPLAMYAHASVGTIHVRPMLDLKCQEDIDLMKAISDLAFGLVKKYGGSWSGEHGDGRVRSPRLPEFFGPQVYAAFREVKHLFDPAGLMNPGPIIDSPPMDRFLRYGTEYHAADVPTLYHFRQSGGLLSAVEMCNGQGACRQYRIQTMCPSYHATRDEEHSTRGRANILRLAMTGQLDEAGLTSPSVQEAMDLCLACKGCKSECPSNVDMARLKGEAQQKWYDAHGTTLRDRLIAKSPIMARRVSGCMAGMVNWFQKTRAFRKVLQWAAGFDSRRVPPSYTRKPFPKWFAKRAASRPAADSDPGRTVVLFDDTYMNYHQPEVGISAVELLESCGYEVVLARAGCCQRPRISHGFLRDAQRDGEQTLRNLDEFIRRGLKVVVCEPGCASALTDDLPDLIDDEELGRRVQANVVMIDRFLADEADAGRLRCEFTSPFAKVLIHGHCHQKALFGTTHMKRLLDRVPGLSAKEIDSGCCGMAGSFGYEVEHYEMSIEIGEQRLFPAIRAREDGAAVVACGFSCRHQIQDGTGVRPVHWVQAIRGKAPEGAA